MMRTKIAGDGPWILLLNYMLNDCTFEIKLPPHAGSGSRTRADRNSQQPLPRKLAGSYPARVLPRMLHERTSQQSNCALRQAGTAI